MKTIFISPKYTATVNDKDYEFITSIGPWTYSSGRPVKWYTDESGHRHRIWMDRVILERKLGHLLAKGTSVEYRSERKLGKEGRLDCTRTNFRIVIKKTMNEEIKRGISELIGGCKGVTRKGSKFRVHIWYYGKKLDLGGARTLHIALCKYGFAYQVLWGGDAYTPEVIIGELHPILKKMIIGHITAAGINPKYLHLDV